MTKRMKRLCMNFKKAFARGETRILPGQLAFSLIMAIIPLLLIFTYIVTAITKSYDLSSSIYTIFPDFIADILVPILNGNGLNGNYLWLFIVGFFLASNGAYAVINTANVLYNIKDQKVFKIRIKAFIMTIFLLLIFMFLIFIPVFGDVIVKFITDLIKSNTTSNLINTIYNISKLPVTIIILYMGIKIIYTLAPDVGIKSSETTYGSIFTVLGWLLSTKIYSIYITKIVDYSVVYGSFATILVLFIWIYVISYIFVIGMIININYYNEEKN